MTAHKKRKIGKKRNKSIACLVNLTSDINQKISHIIDQLRDIRNAVEIIDGSSKYDERNERYLYSR